jgi:GSCFA family
MKFPYAGLPSHQIWARALAERPDGFADPQHAGRFTIDRSTRISSAGSCFAQRIAERLQESGYTYFVAEPGPMWEPAETLRARGYGAYSARFGDIYTTLQLVQLARRATGAFAPQEPPWPHKGRFADPLRPRVEPDGFASPAELEADRQRHLAAVRRMLAESDVFVFTLGLTETWCCTADDAALPLCPGAGIGTFDAERYRFANLSVDENVRYLDEFLTIARALNPHLRVILTVSPVPLAATYEPRHVVQSTFWSKAVLRIAAEEMRRRYDFVDYFASYEIVAGFDGNDGFEPDRRSVSAAAVDRVMHSFFRAYASADERAVAALDDGAAVAKPKDDPCDEVFFERFLAAQSGQPG